MHRFEVTILGSNSAVPTSNRHPTSQLINNNGTLYLVDCGEGTQIQLRRLGLKIQRISHIFISHLHGDHYFGLIGLLNTMHLLGREKPLTIHAHRMLREIINLQLSVSSTKLRFNIHYNFLEENQEALIHTDKNVNVYATPVDHRIPCFGFVFIEQKRPLNISKHAITQYKLGIEEIKKVKAGEDIVRNGQTISNNQLTDPRPPQRKYSFITDTKPNPSYFPIIENSSLLYHETTFMHDAQKRAEETHHTTTLQAAEIANQCHCDRLIIGHFSTRYPKLELLAEEARTVHSNVELAIEGKTFTV